MGPRGRCPLAGFDQPGQVAGLRGSPSTGVSGSSAPRTKFYCISNFEVLLVFKVRKLFV